MTIDNMILYNIDNNNMRLPMTLLSQPPQLWRHLRTLLELRSPWTLSSRARGHVCVQQARLCARVHDCIILECSLLGTPAVGH